jgi:hypothetical protein
VPILQGSLFKNTSGREESTGVASLPHVLEKEDAQKSQGAWRGGTVKNGLMYVQENRVEEKKLEEELLESFLIADPQEGFHRKRRNWLDR